MGNIHICDLPLMTKNQIEEEIERLEYNIEKYPMDYEQSIWRSDVKNLTEELSRRKSND